MSEKKEDAKVKEGKAVDQDGNEVKVDVLDSEEKPIKEGKSKTWKDHAMTALKVLGAAATVVGTGVISYVVGGKKVAKAKDEEIRKLQNDNWELSQELEMSYNRKDSEPDTEDEE